MVDTTVTDDAHNSAEESPFDPSDSLPLELKKARESRGLSFSDVHRLTGLSRNTLHQYESGSRRPGARELVKLCEVLKVSPNRLLFGTEEPFSDSDGVLRQLVRLSRTDPGKALAYSVTLMPLAAAILSSIGGETLEALATLADEALRARDPETYGRLSRLIVELRATDAKAFAKLPEEEKQKVIDEMQRKVAETESTSS